MTIKRFEDIQGWQEARKLTNMVFDVSDKDQFAKSYRLRDQIQGAAISSMANIAEGFDCETDPEFIRFLSYAFRSATEVQSHLYVAIDRHFISQEEFDQIYNKATETKNLIGGFMRYLSSSPRDRKKQKPSIS
jgi:four helix bundle protein